MGRGKMEGGCEMYSIDLNPSYVLAKFELDHYLLGKVGQGQRLCNCVKIL